MLPLQWIRPVLPPACQDQESPKLASFDELQRKTWETLYHKPEASSRHGDKSPKGSVDGPIQGLVDLINHHSAVCTLSSCSGRISLFDPNGSDSSASSNTQTNTTSVAMGSEENERPGSTASLNDNNNESTATLPSQPQPQPQQPFTEASGKGRGRWVLVTHHTIEDPEELVEAVYSTATSAGNNKKDEENRQQQQQQRQRQRQPWMLKLEPMLLHIAARSLTVGQALLQVALECGFRESGLVVTSKRVTVAIRSHSLSLAIPLLPPPLMSRKNVGDGGLCLARQYLRAMVPECNQRIQTNWKQLDRLYQAIESTWFQVSSERLVAHVAPLPPLRLWNAATVMSRSSSTTCPPTQRVPSSMIAKRRDCIYTFGGYGKGPLLSTDGERSTKMLPVTCSRRNSSIYRLRRSTSNGSSWSESQWEAISISPSKVDDACWKGLCPTTITPLDKFPIACQGMAAAPIHEEEWIVLWGGRTSPTKLLESDSLYLFHPVTHALVKVNNCASNPDAAILLPTPTCRWGHCLVPVSDNRLVLVGGKGSAAAAAAAGTSQDADDSDGAPSSTYVSGPLEDIYILHYDDSVGLFSWERLEVAKLVGGRVHAAATVIPGNDGDSTATLVVFGGLAQDCQDNPLHGFSKHSSSQSPSIWACQLGVTTKKQSGTSTVCTMIDDVSIFTTGDTEIRPPAFGAATCSLFAGPLVMMTGGLDPLQQARMSLPLQAYIFSLPSSSSTTMTATPISLEVEKSTGSQGGIDFGSMVHHACIPLSESEFALIGGGVTSFAFGEVFAQSHHVKMILSDDGLDGTTEGESSTFTTSRNEYVPLKLSTHTTTTTTSALAKSAITWVVYVAPGNAKRVKSALESCRWLDKGYRMTKVVCEDSDSTTTPSPTIEIEIAIPIVAEGWALLLLPESLSSTNDTSSSSASSWQTCIVGKGEEEMPYSTAKFASRAGKP